jgi:hypothetical protein
MPAPHNHSRQTCPPPRRALTRAGHRVEGDVDVHRQVVAAAEVNLQVRHAARGGVPPYLVDEQGQRQERPQEGDWGVGGGGR